MKTPRSTRAIIVFGTAYLLIMANQRAGDGDADATCGTIRLKLLKIGALVRLSVRHVHVAMAGACPYQAEFALALARKPPRSALDPHPRGRTNPPGPPRPRNAPG